MLRSGRAILAGMIGLLGSGEFDEWAEPVDRLLLDSAAGRSDRVLILPTASAPEGDGVFDEWGAKGLAHYRKIGASPEVVPLKTRDDAYESRVAEQVADAALIFFSGGNPGYAANVLRETPFWEAVLGALRTGASFGGCSAGAGMLGSIAPNVTSDTAGGDFSNVVWVKGLELLPGVFIGAHWDALDTYVPGLRDFVIASIPAGTTLLAIDEDTAVLGDAGKWKVHGRGGATIIEPSAASRRFLSGESFELNQTRAAVK